jgi:dolichol kinase
LVRFLAKLLMRNSLGVAIHLAADREHMVKPHGIWAMTCHILTACLWSLGFRPFNPRLAESARLITLRVPLTLCRIRRLHEDEGSIPNPPRVRPTTYG